MNGEEIKTLRKSKKWSQQRLADYLGATIRTVWRWEHNESKPLPVFQEKLNGLQEKLKAN
jgi:transcriptional regulator with XRE-family HTH domain